MKKKRRPGKAVNSDAEWYNYHWGRRKDKIDAAEARRPSLVDPSVRRMRHRDMNLHKQLGPPL